MTNLETQPLVYVVEDSLSSGALYCGYLEQAGCKTEHFLDGHSALVAIKSLMPDVIVQDICLPDITGLEVLEFVNRQPSPANVVIVTANSSIDTAVDAMRLGGYDFIEKPFTKDRLLSGVKSALNQKRDEINVPEASVTTAPADDADDADDHSVAQHFVGHSLPMLTVFRLLDSAAKSKASVFVTGESGTGKEVCAQSLHSASARRAGPFIAVNCAAIPTELFESEIFGHEKGAFSGAVNQRKGAAEQADGGTLFLDEICEMDLNLQAKLLRFLQTGTFSRVGGQKTITADVRIVCATNRDPTREVGEGRFREDLYYRLNVIPVSLPPLRDRGDDLLLLANHFLLEKSQTNNKQFKGFSADAIQKITLYDWPGNIREMQNVIENTVVINEGTEVTANMLPVLGGSRLRTPFQSDSPAPSSQLAMTDAPAATATATPVPGEAQSIKPLWQVEKEAIEQAIERCDGNIPLAAACLGVSASTVYRKLKGWS